MIQKRTQSYRSESAAGVERSLQLVLWSLWTLAIVATAYVRWSADVAAGRPFNLLGLLIYSLLTGMIGLLVITIIELRFER
jgi:hypothetical protein